MGNARAMGLGWRRLASTDSIDVRNDAPARSNLLRNSILDLTSYLRNIKQRSTDHLGVSHLDVSAHLSNCRQTPFVWASTPSTASIRTTAPSTTRLALSTSIPKSACPGVSIRLNVQSFHRTGMLADWMVIPRSRSAGKKSVVVLPVSTEPAEDRYWDCSRIDSVSVVLPESASQLSVSTADDGASVTHRCEPQEPCSAVWMGHDWLDWHIA